MKKIFLLFAMALLGFASIGQQPNPDVIKQWYLHAITIDGIDYSPADYGFYPDIVFEENGGIVNFVIETPNSVGCLFENIDFSENPAFFQLLENWNCLTQLKCLDGPEGPCNQIYGMHADFYFNTLQTPLNYTLTYNEDETQTLVVVNNDGDTSLYGSEPLLSTPSFSETPFAVYPNPVSETLFISSENNIVQRISVFSINGKLILSEKGNTQQLDVSALSHGLYFLEIASENKTAIQKFIKR
ncbi:T9SS type A sorting domain-containing protein [Marixanthomonas spongiae]|uniref:Secretion system C-terminal sorting domain-containing protein n=1 Tax=Marixanthomonas spongiae TaxID=2174845 RepID=A0A2U0I8L0_9FLAO|nr:T9SS type A sorting domain-containing protein [Marixanthomonas spongiae]PVW17418.1 hypothetical protein DDV96_02620 [Marixanthomonas spongiae]